MYFRFLLLLSLLQLVTPYRPYQSLIPNGNIVPFPCKPGKIWDAVGHLNDKGHSLRNSFGRDFLAAGRRWTKELCRKDSDGDGMINGLELGDPNCIWEENKQPELTEGLSHPGICDPYEGKDCVNSNNSHPTYLNQREWMAEACQSNDFKCEALKDTDIINITARLPEGMLVPRKETAYICRTFNFHKLGIPRNRDFHMVAVTPNIDNKDILHHIIVFGCTGYIEQSDKPYQCDVTPHSSCTEFMYMWTMGLGSECFYPDTGVRIGKTGYENFIIQYHMSNHELRSDLTDTSGLIFHITPNLKRYDTGVLAFGSTYFDLPPKRNYTVIKSKCASGCTETLINGTIFITAAGNHMHLLGKDMMVELMRNNHHLAYITMDRFFVYDTPQIHHYRKPLEVFPGDTIVTTCGYNTSSRNDDTFWGDGLYDEMCFGFVTYHPKQAATRPSCLDVMGFGMCHEKGLEGCTSLRDFLSNIKKTRAFKEVSENCKPNVSSCDQRCAATVLRHMKMEPCMRGNIWRYIKNELAKTKGSGFDFLSLIAPCKEEAEMAMANDPDKN